ncbi:GMC family oxidoreductase N-terminal domain-containing protein [Streptomyces sp. NPDC001982]|uniref:GMC family oxidoreductase n=1 Tax=Streptomyces sp. NPDC001982 TaxID=3154405 RepID=UPI00331D8936
MNSYDYIVIGAGTAGCVIAARLSEDDRVRVLLIEAGSRQPLEAMAVPPAWPTLMGTSASWGDSTVVQAANGITLPLPRGRALGGSSSINAMLFIRGHRSSYDAWVTAGAERWGFEDLLPYLRRSERTDGHDPTLRGVEGPVTVHPATPRHPLMEAGLLAAEQAGYPAATDISGGLEEGFGRPDMAIHNGRRVSSADAYLTPALGRPNLDVVTDAVAHRVRVVNGRCSGVEYSVDTQLFTADAREEVVLTAGTVGSAQLLLQSGIGPKSHLNEVGVDVVLDLPGVGENLNDHPVSTVTYSPAQPVPPTVHNHGGTLGLVRSDPASDVPDIQIMFSLMPFYGPALPGPDQIYAIVFSAMLPRSRGTLRLASAKPGTAPRIDPNYYADSGDLDVMAAGLRIAREIGQADAFAPWRGEEVLPGPDVRHADRVRTYLNKSLMTYFHPVGACRIGQDDMAVVDSDLRVHGISGLRVADASVMPSVVSANTQATVYGIAERASDLIRGR